MSLNKSIKSFVLRQGKITSGQKNALDEYLPIYGIEFQSSKINLNQIFGRDNAKIMEIGFGMGDATLKTAILNPDKDYLAIEVHLPGVGSLLNNIAINQVKNLKIIRYDVVEILNHMIDDGAISGFHIYFPDPWPKARHHKRRLINRQFIELLVAKLREGGYIHLATDWEDYANSMLEVLNNMKGLSNQSNNNDYIPRPIDRVMTKFEERGLKLGHKVFDLMFIKSDDV